ncbi:MAG: cyclic nucleotide-binding domain-containing protein [Planctomycetota bacterium]|nr:MAG: cyclic nucleotide-binding domain-containing protein [Planctomycetota bacterium]REJ88633.1 MAG: cyclic nucleotide-binding domain-containing protein [Planctomycetota bacterium]REK27216.1 MAG: cyclic nucleotide-binding domain-containing protein [Planctomycetota bacterium]REK36762.1 MAG: cyclic nucleotide-binding domain-containing protein [Planctomycetota bacterium]
MSEHGTILQLKKCVLLQDMNSDELDAVFRLTESEDFAAGEEILTEGLAYQSLWIIVTGRCEVVKSGNGLEPNRLAELEEGAVFGEMSFFEKAPHSASVRALSDVSTMRLTRRRFEDLRKNCPAAADKIACNLVNILSTRLRRMDEWTCQLVEGNCSERQQGEWQEFRAKLYSGLQF